MTNEEKEIVFDNQKNDQRITNVEAMANANVENIGNTYDDMIVGTDTYYQELKNNVQTWADKQTELQKEQGELAVKQLEQQQEQAEKDYTKEQSAAYADYTKQTQKHGVNAEQMAEQGFAGSGYSESAQVSMYNTYQNRVATAKASFDQVKANYEISIAEAKLQNNAALAEIAFEAMQKQLELSLEGFQYKNTLLIEKTNQITNAKNNAWTQYMDVLDQIYKEDSLAESARQHQLDLAEKQRQFDAELAWDKDKLKSQQEYDREQAEIDRRHEAEQAILKRNHDYKIVAQNLANDKELLNYQKSLDKEEEEIITPDNTGNGEKPTDLYGYTIERENVSNKHGTNWVTVDGLGNMTWGQLQKKVEAGAVSATWANGKVKYVYEGETKDRDEFNASKVSEYDLQAMLVNGYITEVKSGRNTKYYWTKLGKQMQNSM